MPYISIESGKLTTAEQKKQLIERLTATARRKYEICTKRDKIKKDD